MLTGPTSVAIYVCPCMLTSGCDSLGDVNILTTRLHSAEEPACTLCTRGHVWPTCIHVCCFAQTDRVLRLCLGVRSVRLGLR